MTQHYMLGILVLVTCSLLGVWTYPSNNESSNSVEDVTENLDEKAERSLMYDETKIENDDNAKEIIKKIAALNEALKKPNRRHSVPWKVPPPINSGYVLDKDILEKLQQVIASGKLHPYQSSLKQQETNAIFNENVNEARFSKHISPLLSNYPIAIPTTPAAYISSIPILVVPSRSNINGYGNLVDYNSIQTSQYQTKEGPSPFQPLQLLQNFGQLQWPFASYFPILIRDPLLSIINGGGFQNFLEVGQSADVCNRKQKTGENVNMLVENENPKEFGNFLQNPHSKRNFRVKRAIKKLAVTSENPLPDSKKLFPTKPFFRKPTKSTTEKVTKDSDESENLRFPFLFGNRDKIPKGPHIFISKLKVRKGGIAIAGPGGIATAGHGGAAIVGPGGLAYTQPGGLAVAGPDARVVALSSDADLTSIANRLQQQSTVNGSVSSLLQVIPEGKVVAIGPVIYFHPNKR